MKLKIISLAALIGALSLFQAFAQGNFGGYVIRGNKTTEHSEVIREEETAGKPRHVKPFREELPFHEEFAPREEVPE